MAIVILILLLAIPSAGVVGSYALIYFTARSYCLKTDVGPELWSDDHVIKAVLSTTHCTGGWMSPRYETYSLRVDAVPSPSVGGVQGSGAGSSDGSRSGWYFVMPIANDAYLGPVSVKWTAHRTLLADIVAVNREGLLFDEMGEIVVELWWHHEATGKGNAAAGR